MLSLALLTFTASFSTMSYAMLTASIISDFTGEEVYSQCLSMGPYLLGLGVGSALGDRIKESELLRTLWKLEWVSVIVLPLIPIFQMVCMFLFLNLAPPSMSFDQRSSTVFLLGLAALVSLVSGLLGGAQLPIIIKMAKRLGPNVILALSYLGPLLAGPAIIFMGQNAYSVSTQVTVVALVQFLGLLVLIGMASRRVPLLLGLVFPMAIMFINLRYYPTVEHFTIKSSYMKTRLQSLGLSEVRSLLSSIAQYGDLTRTKTAYQVIDLYVEPPNLLFQRPGNSTVYLNRKPQFDLQSVDIYHQSMVHAALNVKGGAGKNILILGAGDGILLKELRAVGKDSRITMVELDEGMINWSKDHYIVSQLNQNSMNPPAKEVDLIVDDAISYLRRNQRKDFDLIFIDFPFPNGHELAKLYSFEFYRLVKRALGPAGVLIIDVPILFEASDVLTRESSVILKTMEAAGLVNPFAISPYSSFVVFRGDGKKGAFDYSRFSADMNVSTRLNLVEIADEKFYDEKALANAEVNSMFWPKGL